MRIIWKEMKEWKKHWSWGRFFLVLAFGLGASLFDFGSDFNFAWTVEDDCGFEKTERNDFDSPCGSVHYKNIERLTFTFVAYPGIFLSFAAIHRVTKELVGWCKGGEAKRVGAGLARASVITFEVCRSIVERPVVKDGKAIHSQSVRLHHTSSGISVCYLSSGCENCRALLPRTRKLSSSLPGERQRIQVGGQFPAQSSGINVHKLWIRHACKYSFCDQCHHRHK